MPSLLVKLPQRYQNSHMLEAWFIAKPGERCEFSDLAGERFIPYRQNIREVTANRYFEVERKVSNDQRGDRVQQMERAEDE